MVRGLLLALMLCGSLTLVGCDFSAGEKSLDELVATVSEVNAAVKGVSSDSDVPGATARVDSAIRRLIKLAHDNPNINRQRVSKEKMDSGQAEIKRLTSEIELHLTSLSGRLSDKTLFLAVGEFGDALTNLSTDQPISPPSARSTPTVVAQAPPPVTISPAPQPTPSAGFGQPPQPPAPPTAEQQMAEGRQRMAEFRARADEMQKDAARKDAAFQSALPPVSKPMSYQAPASPGQPSGASSAAAASSAPPVVAGPPVKMVPVKTGNARPKPGAKIEVYKGTQWWPATVVKLNTERTLVHFEPEANSLDEWVPFNRMREPEKP